MSVSPVHYSSASTEWYTPPRVLDPVYALFGAVDLDPCSNAPTAGGPNVRAARHYTEADDGLAQPWDAGTVFCNPPYSRAIGRWVARAVAEHAAGRAREVILLLPARTDTRWWRLLRPHPVCFVAGRLRFSHADAGAPFPSAIAYLGHRPAAFAATFSPLGEIRGPALDPATDPDPAKDPAKDPAADLSRPAVDPARGARMVAALDVVVQAVLVDLLGFPPDVFDKKGAAS